MAAPTVTSVSPTGGPSGGGSIVTITGTNFTGATAVTFGGLDAASFTVDSATSITAIAPASMATSANVRVTTPDGTSAISVAFTYGVAPTAPTYAAATSNIAYDAISSQKTGALSTGLGYASNVSTSATLADQRIGGTAFNVTYHAPTP